MTEQPEQRHRLFDPFAPHLPAGTPGSEAPVGAHEDHDAEPWREALDGTVDDAETYVDEHPEHAAAMLQAEQEGKARKTLVPVLAEVAELWEAEQGLDEDAQPEGDEQA